MRDASALPKTRNQFTVNPRSTHTQSPNLQHHPLLNALDADRDLFNAELSLTQTGRNELLAPVQLYKALGGGWQP